MAVGLNLAPGSVWFGRVRAWWRVILWLCLFLLLARLLYLPWSRSITTSEERRLAAMPNTSVVLEGVGQDDATVLTIQLDGFRSVRLSSPRAALSEDSRLGFEGVGVSLPVANGPGSLAWSVKRPPESAKAGLLTIEFVPSAGADLTVGTLDGLLKVRSSSDLGVTPTAQDYDVIDGSLDLGGVVVTAAADVIPSFRVSPTIEDKGAQVTIAYRADELTLLLGDPQGDQDSVPVRSVALIDDTGQLVRRLCGAPRGKVMLWSTLFQPRLEPQPPPEQCKSGYLTASRLQFKDEEFVLGLRGSAFVPGMS
jgi:hypothetical protein